MVGNSLPQGEPTTIILLNGHSIQLFLKPYLSTHPRVHFSDFNREAPMQWTVVNAHNWEQVSLKGRDQPQIGHSHQTLSSPPTLLPATSVRNHVEERAGRLKSQGSEDESEPVSSQLMNPEQLWWSENDWHKIKPIINTLASRGRGFRKARPQLK